MPRALKARLKPGLQAEGFRVALRRAPEAPRLARSRAGALRYEIVRRSDGAVIGEVKCRGGEPAAGWLTVRDIVVGEGWRGWGYGSEAVWLLEAEAQAERFRADVEAGNGLALYFWLRLGYRPGAAGGGAGRAPSRYHLDGPIGRRRLELL